MLLLEWLECRLLLRMVHDLVGFRENVLDAEAVLGSRSAVHVANVGSDGIRIVSVQQQGTIAAEM